MCGASLTLLDVKYVLPAVKKNMIGFLIQSGLFLGRNSQITCSRVRARRCMVDSIEDVSDEELDGLLRQAEGPTGDKYQLSTSEKDPIATALRAVCGCNEVKGFELMDSRWNGNEAIRADTDRGNYFVKINRVEDASVFMSEAVGLTTIRKTETVYCPMPLHVGSLPKVGEFGPGAFMILEWLPLVPFGASRPEAQEDLGHALAMMHMSSAMDEIHEGKFGFVINNYLSLTPMDNRWTNDWSEFLARRMSLLLRSLFEPKVYARAPFKKDESSELINLTEKLIGSLKDRFADVPVKPSLLHGDLWIGNAGFTKDKAVVYDPACFFGHSEMDLAIMELFGGFTDKFYNAYHSRIPKAEGFEERSKIYKVYHYLNQLNLFGNEQVKVEVIKLLRELVES